MTSLLRPYRAWLALLVLFGLLGNGVNLVLPWLLGAGVAAYSTHGRLPEELPAQFIAAAVGVLLFTTLQSVVQIVTAERVSRELRDRLADRISRQTWEFVLEQQPGRLLTNLTSDVDAVKVFVAHAIPSLLSSLVLLVGCSILLVSVNWRLGLTVLLVVPAIGLTFFGVLRRMRPLFRKSREIIDQINTRVKQNVVGAALVRVLHASAAEQQRFADVNARALDLGLTIVANFSIAIPLATFFANAVNAVILGLGGREVIAGVMSVGELATFNGYVAVLIFPIFALGFMSNLIAHSQAAYARLETILQAPEPQLPGTIATPLQGHVEVRNVSLQYGEKSVLEAVSLDLQPGTRTALTGPTAAGKSQLLYLLIGLLTPQQGEILYDGLPLAAYDPNALRRSVAAVFQESILFHLSVRENIAFSQTVTPEALQKAVETAELHDFLRELPQGLDTVVSERGSSLSGGQKQRVMLARALALEPTVLLLDDFTARVDSATETRIADNLRRNYPNLTVLTITQRIAPVQDYERIVLLMEGQVLGSGTHAQLLQTCPEYVQIYESQKSVAV